MTEQDLTIQDLRREVAQLKAELEWKDKVIELAQRNEMRWISVEDKLPPIDTRVVGWCKDNPFSHFTYEAVSWHGSGWVFPYAMRYVTNVTHWMPLPSAPKEANDD